MKKINYTYYLFIYIITIGIVFTHCKKEEIQLIQTKTMVGDSAVYFSNDAGKTFIKALYVNGVHYGNVDQGLYYSTNKGSSWTLSNISQKIDSIWYVANIFIAQGKTGLFGSTNGQQFTSLPIQATIKAVTTNNNLAILFTNKGVFTATNLQNINTTNITDSVQININLNNTIFVGTAKGLYYFNDNNFTLTNIKNSISNIYTNNGLIIANGDSLYFSTNGIEYKKVITLQNTYFANTNDSLYYSNNWGVSWVKSNIGKVDGVNYKDNFFEVLATNGKKYYSSDGADWVLDGIWYAKDDGPKYYYSRDGKKWYETNYVPSTITGMTYKYDKYVTQVNDRLKGEYIGYSNDGFNFIESFNSQDVANRIFYWKNKWYLLSGWLVNYSYPYPFNKVYSSVDGINWIYENGAVSDILRLCGLNDNFLLLGSGNIAKGIINLGSSWKNLDFNPITLYIDNNLIIVNKISGFNKYTLNGINWINLDINDWIYKITKSNNKFVATTNNIYYYSNDGINWFNSNFKIKDYFSLERNPYDIDIKAINGTFITSINYDTTNLLQKGIIFYSNDGLNWFKSNLDYSKWVSIDKIYVNDGIFYANTINNHYSYGCSPCDGDVYYSINGKDWYITGLQQNFRDEEDIKKINNVYVASMRSSANSPFSYSYNKLNFQPANSPSTRSSYKLAQGQNKIVGGIDHKGIFYTLDGINWLPTNITSGSGWGITINFYSKE